MKLYFLTEKLLDQMCDHLKGGGHIEVSQVTDNQHKLYVRQITKTNNGCALLGHEVPSQCAWEDDMGLLVPLTERKILYNEPLNVYAYNVYLSGKRNVRLTTHLK